MYKNHAVRTKDEKIWKCFSGEVPRKGEDIHFLGDDHTYTVTKVEWFIEDCNEKGLEEPETISSARVYIDYARL